MSLLERPRAATLAPAHGNVASAGTRPAGSPLNPGKPRTPRPVRAPQETAARRPRRDPFLDLLRALGTVAVVIAHWLMPQATWDGQTLDVVNVLGSGPGWLITWCIQVIPMMFFVAGAATFSQMSARTVAWWPFMTARVSRILPPVAVFLGTWLVAAQVLPMLGAPQSAVIVAATIAPQLLWYLGIYAGLLGASHGLRAFYQRFGLGAVASLGAAAVLVDVVRFAGGVEPVGLANLFLVWAFAYTLGYAYADGRFAQMSRRASGSLALVGLGSLVAATTFGPYPLSMVGMPGDAFSNMGPPTLCLVALTLVQVFGMLTFRSAITSLAETSPARRAVGWISARSMTLYLWHLTAMFVVVGLVTVGANVDLPQGWTAGWWGTRPLWFAACMIVLLCLVKVFGPVETRRTRRRTTAARTASSSAAARTAAPAAGRSAQVVGSGIENGNRRTTSACS